MPGLRDNLAAQADAGYRVMTTDLMSGRKTGDFLPLLVGSCSRQINGPGSLDATGSLDAASDLRAVLLEGRTAIWLVDPTGEVIWGGVIWDPPQPDVAGRTVRVSATGFADYFTRRRILNDLVLYNLDQFVVFKRLVDYAQAQPHGNLGIGVEWPKLSGVTRAFWFYAKDVRQVSQALADLTTLPLGLEWTEGCRWDPASGRPKPYLTLGYPQLGRTGARVMWEYPGNVETYSEAPSTSIATKVIGLGAQLGDVTLTSVQTDTTDLAAGYPLIEEDTGSTYNWITAQADLDAHTAQQLALRSTSRFVFTLTVLADQSPRLGEWRIGDTARFRATSAWHRQQPDGRPGLDVQSRVVAWSLKPRSASQADRVDITLNNQPRS